MGKIFIGIDLGSTTVKAVALNGKVIASAIRPTGANPRKTGEAVLGQVLAKSKGDVKKTGELINELEKRIKRGEGVVPRDTPRILISGTPMTVPNWKLHDIIEKSSAVVVAEESCTGTRYFSDLVEANSGSVNTQLKNLAERYLHINCACFTPNAERPEDVVRLAKEYKADGVVYYVLQFCHEFNIEFVKVERALKEEGIPVIKIETDYSQSDTGQLKTRLETFIEILKSSKTKSKAAVGSKPPASTKVPLGAGVA